MAKYLKGKSIYKGEVNFKEILQIYKQSKVIVNIQPYQNISGTQERVINSLFLGCNIVTDGNYYKKLNIPLLNNFDISDTDSLIHAADNSLKLPNDTDSINKTITSIKENFSFENIVGNLLSQIGFK